MRLAVDPGHLMHSPEDDVAEDDVAEDDVTEADRLRAAVTALVDQHDPQTTPRLEFLRARFAAGLAWVHYPVGLGGLGAPRWLQPMVEVMLAEAGAPDNDPARNGIGLGMAAPTILAHGTPEQQSRFLGPLWTGEEVWCQLFSEPGAGSDLAALATRAVRDGDAWVVNGQKVWTSNAHSARWAILVARTDPDVPKHEGITYFVCDMTALGVEVRPLRQLTGEAEFNEVFLTDVRLPDHDRLGPVGHGWAVAQTTLNNERVAIGGGAPGREAGYVGVVARRWRNDPTVRAPHLHDRLLRLWVDAEVFRLTGARLRQQLATGHPGPEGAGMKVLYARLNQQLSAFEVEMLGEEGARYDQWTMRRPEGVEFLERNPGFRYLRAKGNSIEGGTSEILRNIVAERVLALPREPNTTKGLPWKDLPK
jgi:alkylation response protein AidB-like acyl-CoA dehydrogenase